MTRQQLVSRVLAKLRKQQHVLLVGDAGSGKSWLLDAVAGHLAGRPLVRAGMTMTRKQMVLSIAEQMHAQGCNVDADPAEPWDAAYKRLKGYTVEQLLEVIEPYCGDFVFLLDDLDLATERTNRELAIAFAGTVLATANLHTNRKQIRVAPMVNRVHPIEVPPLDYDEAVALLWAQLDRGRFPHWQALQTKMWNVSRGKPGVIMDMLDKLGRGMSIGEIRELEHSADGIRYVNLLVPSLLILMVLVISARYLSHGFDDPSTYMIAAIGYAIFRVFSPVLYRLSN